MRLLLELSMECESLARSEALAAARALGGSPRALREETGILVMQSSADPIALGNRLALCHFVSEWLGSCPRESIVEHAEGLDVSGPIRVRSTRVGESSVDLASVTGKVGAAVAKGRGVDLRAPKSDIRVVFSKDAHFGRVLHAIDRTSYEKRKNRYLPFVYPASLHPKYARAIVNLAAVGPAGRLLDPFCGTGAILAEAALVGLQPIGTDCSQRMIDGARRNLKHLGLGADLKTSDVGDIVSVAGRVDGIATDPPYGRSTSTRGEPIPSLYKRALRAFSEVLSRGGKVGVVVPELSLLQGADDLVLREKHGLWVHRSLTRQFCVLEKR